MKIIKDEDEITELEEKITELEKLAKSLDEKFSDVEGAWGELLAKSGNRVRSIVDNQVDARIDEVEYRMLKKLVDGNIFELKMKEQGK